MDKCELRTINGNSVYFRIENEEKGNEKIIQNLELEKVIKSITGEEFHGLMDSRRMINNDNFKLIERYPAIEDKDKDDNTHYTCLCSENKCSFLAIIKHVPTNNFLAIGSSCYKRFNTENSKTMYHVFNAKKCEKCNVPLVFRECNYPKNTKSLKDKCCIKCESIKRRVYLNVKFADKENAKSMGAFWDAELKKWYAPNSSLKYHELILKYANVRI